MERSVTLTPLPTRGTPRRPPAPSGLGDAGRALWTQFTGLYKFRVDELRILAEVSRTEDELATINAALVGAPAMVAGPHGRTVPNPLYEEARRHRGLKFRGLAALGLADAHAADERDPRARSAAGRALAHQRWEARGG
jgi:hypothetical protein